MPDITGTPAPETLDGTTGDDRIFGLDGDDTLNGLAGNDYLQGDAGNDTLNGGEDDDTYLVDSGDIVNESVGQGFDIVYALTSYVLAAAASVERLSSTNHLETTAKDLFGNDTVIDIFGNNGANILTGGAANNYLLGFGGDDTLNGLGGADLLFGMNGTDTLNGGAGNDYLDGGAGNDNLNGGADDDFYLVDSGDTIGEADGEGYDVVYALASYVLAASARVELLSSTDHLDTTAKNLTGNDFVPTLYGNNGANTITGGSNANLILGFAGNDTLNGLDGADSLFGMGDNDTLNGGAGNDYLEGGSGNNTVAGGTGDDIYVVSSSTDTIVELDGEGLDSVYVTASTYLLSAAARVELLSSANSAGTERRDLTGNNWVGDIYGNNGVNRLVGGSANNTILGLAGDDIIFGMAGNDVLDGGPGIDHMTGGAGNDTYYVDNSSDEAGESEGASDGNDIVYTSVDYQMGFNTETMATMDAAGTTALRLFGSASDNVITGNAGANLIGTGGGGTDTLTGLGGADIFNFGNMSVGPTGGSSPLGVATITDFTQGLDKLRLDSTKFSDVLAAGPAFLEIGATATSAATRILYDPATGNLLYDRDGNASGVSADPGRIFGRIQPGLSLTTSDFIIEANQAPEANADNYAIMVGAANSGLAIGMKQNDFDLDGGGLTVTRAGVGNGPMVNIGSGLTPTLVGGIYGILAGGGKGNTFDYTLIVDDPDTIAIAPGQTVFETYTYEVSDGALSSQATITIAITRSASGALSGTPQAMPGEAKDAPAPGFAAVDDAAFATADDSASLPAVHGPSGHPDALPADLWLG